MKHRVIVVTNAQKNEHSMMQLAHIQYKLGEDKTLEMVIDDLEAKIVALENENNDLKQENKSLKEQDKKLSEVIQEMAIAQAQLRTMLTSDIADISKRIAIMEEK